MARSIISSGLEFSLWNMWYGDVPMPVWIRPFLEYFSASAATSISFSTARVRAHIVGQVTAFDISTTELKSPGLEIGKPASITSTPSSCSALATSIFSMVFSWHPGTCSPSRKVVSKMYSLSLITKWFYFYLYKKKSHPPSRMALC